VTEFRGETRRLSPGLAVWPVLAVAITLLCALVHLAVQQDIRLGANDPQIQLAHDAAAALAQGKRPADVVPSGTVDLATSLATHVTVFDAQGRPLASSASLEGATPAPPAGVFDYARTHEEDRFTWQPRPGVRIAAVLVHHAGASPGFVLAGRSLREVEDRESQLTATVALAWTLTLGATLAVAFLGARVFR